VVTHPRVKRLVAEVSPDKEMLPYALTKIVPPHRRLPVVRYVHEAHETYQGVGVS